MRRTTLLAAVTAAASLAVPAAAGAQGPLPYAPCQSPQGAECASLDVPLDRAGRVPGTVRLNAVRVRAGAAPTATAVVALAGGPGQAAIPLTGAFADGLGEPMKTRDLLVFDQRGTGSSGPLQCSALRSGGSQLTVASRCANELGPARAFYRTSDSVQDLEALRAASGYAKLVVYGVSYGTKVALDYAAAYPQNVEALVLDSVVLPEGPDPLRVSSLSNVTRVLQELCAGRECRSATPSVTRDLRRLAARLRRRDARGTVVLPTGRRVRLGVDETDVFQILLAGDVNPALRAELPGSVRAALTGDLRPLLRLAVRSAGLDVARRDLPATPAFQSSADADSRALFLATICEEAPFRWTRTAGPNQRAREITAAARAIPSSRLGPFSREVPLLSGIAGACLGWPAASPPPAAPGALPNVPTLVVEGRADLRTPLTDAEQLKGRIPAAQVLPVPFVGHSVLGSDPSRCGEAAVTAFFSGAPVAPCTATDNPFSPTPKPPLRLGNVRPLGLSGTRGRTLAAVVQTITDARRQAIGAQIALGRPPTAVGGLRSGRATIATNGITLRSYEYVPGVRVSGTLGPDGGGTFAVRGSGARGTVRQAPSGALSGTLGGRSFGGGARAASVTAPDDGLPSPREVARLRPLR
jgi:pimeloyl-ACP methyl ester carboxylesterase